VSKIKKVINKWDSLPLTFRASFVYLWASIIQKGLAFLTSPIFTRILTSAEYGTASVFFSLEQLIGTVAMFCLSAGCFDIGMQDYKEDRDRFCFSILILSNLITALTGTVLLIAYPLIKDVLGISRLLLVVMFIVFMLQPAFTFWTRRERFEYHYKMTGILTIISAVIASALAIISILAFPTHRIEARIIGQFAPLLLLYVVFWLYLGKNSKFQIEAKYIKFAFLFNLPLIPHYLSSYVLNSSDRLMINRMVGASEAGYYSLAYSVSALVTVVWTAINSSLVPYIFEKYEKKNYKQVSDTLLPILTAFAAICLVIIMIGPEVISLLGPGEYRESVYVIPPVIGGMFFQSLYYIFTNVLYYLKRPRIVMYASLSSAALNIILNYIFIKVFGYVAAGYTTLICFGLQAFVDYIIVRRIMGEDIYDKKYITILSCIVITVSLLSNLLYKYTTVRYLLIVIVAIVLIVKRNILINLFRKKQP